MTAKAWNRRAPWDTKTGELLGYVYQGQMVNHSSGGSIEWRLADEPFEKSLTFEGFLRGRSAAGAAWKDDEGHTYYMFLTDLDELVRTGRPLNAVNGHWIVVKRGENFGIKLAPVRREYDHSQASAKVMA